MIVRTISLIGIILISPGVSHSQHSTISQGLYWLRYQAQFSFSPSLYWTNEGDNRRFFSPDVENQLIFHSRLHYKTGRWDFAGGLTLSFAYAQLPEQGYKTATTELRPVAELTHEFTLKKFTLQNRLRVDNRFFEVSEETSIWEDSRYVLRLRYRMQAKIPLKKSEEIDMVILRLAEEIMVNDRENFFDQNRIYVTSEFYLSKRFSLETGYIYIYQQRFGTENFFSRHVLRFSVFHRIN
jgi:hypothetical protein